MQAWDSFLKNQTKELGVEAVNKWLRPLKVVHFDAANLYLEAKDTFQALWFEEHIRPRTSSLLNQNNRPIKIHLSIANQNPQKNKEKKNTKTVDIFKIIFETLDPHCLFKNVVPHEGNALAYKLLCKAAGYDTGTDKLLPGETELALFNPIFLHGPTGTGKTQFLQAVAHALTHRGLNVRYSRAESFTAHVVSAIRAGEMSAFRQAYRAIDVLIIDDVQVFSRKRATQEEFFHSFNALHLSGKQILISANCSPQELNQIEQRLISRFEWGIVLSLERPDKTTLKAITERKALNLKFPLPSKVIDFLTNTFISNPKVLSQALDALILRTHLQNLNFKTENLTIPIVKHHLADLIHEEQKTKLTADKILESVSSHFDIDIEDLIGKSQNREVVLPRKIAMHLCREQLKMSFTKIGELFERDHSTVMTSVKIILNNLKENDAETTPIVTAILKKINA